MTRLTVLWFASLRDARGVASEVVQTDARDLRELYLQLQACHGLGFAPERMRVAVGDGFARWNDAPREGSEVAFIPPVSGG